MATTDHDADVAVVVVHGIGQQVARDTLYAWAEPLAAELDLLSRSRHGVGVRVDSVADDPVTGGRILLTVPAPGARRRIAMTEARWSESFLTMSNAEVVGWMATFGFRAAWRLARHLARLVRATVGSARDLVDLGVTSAREGPSQNPNLSVALGQALVLVVLGLAQVVVAALGLVAIVLLLPAVLALALVAVAVLLALSFIPGVGGKVRRVLVGLSGTLGDAAVWTRRPLRAAAMRDVVRAEIRRARARAGTVIVVAHSQGAAVSAAACLGPGAERVDVLVTVGGAVTLLGSPDLSGPMHEATALMEAWRGSTTRWINAWAVWDPVPSGPVGFARGAATRRWRDCLANGAALEAAERAEAEREPEPERVGGPVGFALDLVGLQRRDPISLSEVLRKNGVAVEGDEGEPASDRADGTSVPDATTAPIALAPRSTEVGPEEWPLHNHSSVITDHVTYTANRAQLARRLALLVTDPSRSFVPEILPRRGTEERVGLDRERLYTTAVRASAQVRAACLVVGGLGSAALLRAWFPWVADQVDGLQVENGVIRFALDVVREGPALVGLYYGLGALLIWGLLAAVCTAVVQAGITRGRGPVEAFLCALGVAGLGWWASWTLWHPDLLWLAVPGIVVFSVLIVGPGHLGPVAENRTVT